MPREEVPFSPLTEEDSELVEEDMNWEKHMDFSDLKEEKELNF